MTIDDSIQIAAHLPYLRRYARARTGSRKRGDELAEAALLSILEDGAALGGGADPKIALFRQLQDKSGEALSISGEDVGDIERLAMERLGRLAPGSRDALLLKAVEKFTDGEIAEIMRTDPQNVGRLIEVARLDIARSIAGRLLVIEDKPAVAADLGRIVSEMGHDLIGTAPSADEAVEMARDDEPDLILSDIRLRQGGSGIDAVGRILGDYPGKPVIFVSGFPEDLLTGRGSEPAFVISKPYNDDLVRSAVSQAMFFSPRKRARL